MTNVNNAMAALLRLDHTVQNWIREELALENKLVIVVHLLPAAAKKLLWKDWKQKD